MKNKVIVGTRTSKLALFQTNKVIFELKKNFRNLEFEIKEVKTKGDILLNQTLDRNLDKGFFVKEIQQLIIEEKIDIAVHSLKDLPVDPIPGLELSAILERDDPRDALILSSKLKSNIELNESRMKMAYCPSRASLMSGQYPHNHGVLVNTHIAPSWTGGLDENKITFSSLLKEKGYTLDYLGKWHVNQNRSPEHFGFDKYNDGDGSSYWICYFFFKL